MCIRDRPQVTLLPLPARVKFYFQLTPEEREAEQVRYLALAEQARTLGAQPDCGLLVLDEVCAAVNTGPVSYTHLGNQISKAVLR